MNFTCSASSIGWYIIADTYLYVPQNKTGVTLFSLLLSRRLLPAFCQIPFLQFTRTEPFTTAGCSEPPSE